MIVIECNRQEYEYDLYALTRSFFPQREVKFIEMTDMVNDNDDSEKPNATEPTEQEFGTSDIKLRIRIHIQSMEEGDIGTARLQIIDYEKHNNADKTATFDRNGEKVKSRFKVFFYDFMSEYTQTVLPWGNLTGIRPTKLAMQMLEEGRDLPYITETLQREHRVSVEKINLSVDIASREKEILDKDCIREGYSLYIGIPFCPSTCLYCSFTSYPIVRFQKIVWDYLYAMEKEMDYWAARYRDKILTTVYIGGGTPTTLTAEQMDWLLGKVKSKFNFNDVLEFTVEAGRADSITEEKLQAMKKHAVSRISVNPQTMNDKTLQLIGRQASVEDVLRAYELARKLGFNNINMDIILGLPGEGIEEVLHTTQEIKKLQPDSLTVHSLAIKRASALNRLIAKKGYIQMLNTDETMILASQAAKEMNMVPYYLYRQKNMAGNFENVGYATKGKYGIYNILIMEEKQTIVAIGAGSITKMVYPSGRMERSDNIKDVTLYIAQIDEMIERKRRL